MYRNDILLAALVLLCCAAVATSQSSVSRCFQFTWLGPRYHNGSEFMNATCGDATRLASGVPCREPLVASFDGTWPDVDYIWTHHSLQASCILADNDVCAKYTYYFNNHGKKKPEDAKIMRYPDSDMQSAIAAVREGRFKIREAARHFGVPHSTLINKLKGRVPEVRKTGRDTYFTPNEENLLVKYIIASAKKGIPIKRQTLIETVKKILDDDERVTPFKNNRPGRKWIELFYNRHPEITEKQAEGISTARANVSENDIKSWHKSLGEFLAEENALDILEDPKRIFNADESGFQTCPDSGKVLGPVGMKNFFQIKSGKEKEQVTVMVTINAAGQVVTPLIVYPLIRISKEISANVPENWGIGKSQKGWMTGPLYFEYIANIFDPWVKENNIKKPVLLLIDGHRSHLTLQVSQYCADNQIIAYALFPNSTHISQPADVSVFKCMKSGWNNTVREYKESTGNRQITRAGFAPLLAKVFEDKVTPEVVANGFKRCGIYPFDVTAMDLTKCMDNDTRKTAPLSVPSHDIGVEMLFLFESYMRRGRVEEFRRSSEQWEGKETAKELFYVWKKFRQNCLSKRSSSSVDSVTSATKSFPPIIRTPPVSDTSISSRLQLTTSSQQKQNTANLPEESNIPTRCNTPVSKATDLLGDSTRCNTPISKIPDPPEESKTSTRCNTPVSKAPDLPEESETSTRCSTPVSMAVDLQEKMEIPTRSCTPVSKVSIIPEASGTPSASNKLLLLVKKQKQVSPAFGNHIIWPSDSPTKNFKKERLPFATTSKKWQDYWLAKDNEKEEQHRKKEIRKRVREEKNVKKSKKIPKLKKVIKSETSQVTKRRKKGVRIIRSGTSDTSKAISDQELEQKIESVVNSDEETEKETKNKEEAFIDSENTECIEVGQFVIFVYEGTHFVGRIESISEEGALIKSMHQSLKKWKWPEKEDLMLYRIDDIKEKIQNPEIIHKKRGLYHVPEFEKYREYV